MADCDSISCRRIGSGRSKYVISSDSVGNGGVTAKHVTAYDVAKAMSSNGISTKDVIASKDVSANDVSSSNDVIIPRTIGLIGGTSFIVGAIIGQLYCLKILVSITY